MVDVEDKTTEQEIEDEINTVQLDDLKVPLPEDKTPKQKHKLLKEYSKNIKAKAITDNYEILKGKRKEIKDMQREIEKNYLYYRGVWQKIKEKFTGRSYLKIGIITSSMDIKYYQKPIKPNKTVVVKKKMYLINKEGLLFTNGRPTFIYFEGNSNPIIFNPDIEANTPIVSSNTMYDLFQSKVIGEMFSGMSMGRVVGWTVGTILAVGGVAFLVIIAGGGSIDQMIGKEQIIMGLPIWQIKHYFQNRTK